jgi:diaminohydroxyphosphoribosylaminopyrimidine deaminase / 5-amino-6-(5-phosphoribosylamino)uracil reductase
MTDWSQADRGFMDQALTLAASQRGRTGASPAVGCVIVRDGQIVGQGATGDGGRPHGEALALIVAGDQAHGATVYVTLEPCAHQSDRGPTCVISLIEAGIARLVCCLQDPDPRTAGQGFDRLRQAGVRLDIGLCEAQGAAQIAEFKARFEGKA